MDFVHQQLGMDDGDGRSCGPFGGDVMGFGMGSCGIQNARTIEFPWEFMGSRYQN